MRITFFLSVLVGISACNLDKNTPMDETKAKFTTSDASELFFKNVRQIRYDQQEMPKAKLNIFRWGDRSMVEDYPAINLAIVINWRYDEAYILTEPNEYLLGMDSIRITWQDSVRQRQGVYRWSVSGNKESQFTLASQLYRSIQLGHQLYITNPRGEEEEFLNHYDEREALRITMFDYYRLVDLL